MRMTESSFFYKQIKVKNFTSVTWHISEWNDIQQDGNAGRDLILSIKNWSDVMFLFKTLQTPDDVSEVE